MLTHAIKLVVVAFALWMLPGSAEAQRIHPDCAKRNFSDKVGCTCALENGGAIVPRQGGGWRWVSRYGHRQVNDGFIACMKRHGRS